MPLAIIRNTVFYLAAAQVIPVVVLALVVLVEFNTRRLRGYLPIYLRLIAFLGFALCGLAEWRSLRVLETGHARGIDPWIVWTALATLAVTIIVGSAGSPFSPMRKPSP
jgi:hypothetical protein